ncbi:unnamed protein product [Allacma fusca]|uniref:Uncharacterized protein n=1 Tax=Allacma fusca TaxID=39272 RepID=A0A8J2L500_9HEXA|nr:unnamed protein product [Allacma fusca]
MKSIILLCLFVAGSTANGYGAVLSYSAPAPAAPVRSSYSAPATPVRSYSAPAAPVRSSYSAPAPATPVLSYSAPAPASPPAYGSSYGASNAAPIAITRLIQDHQEGSHHHVSFETAHGIRHEERTSLRMNPNAVGTPEDALAGRAIVTKTGSFSYMSPEGHPISTGFNANENGADFTGQHLPVSVTETPEVAQARREHLAIVEEAFRVAARNPEVPQSYGGYAAPAEPLRAPVAPPQLRSPY